jgi:hypothetical protein
MHKTLTALIVAMAISGTTLTTAGVATAEQFGRYHHRIDPWRNPNFWGYGGWVRGGWCLGGAEFIPITPYGPYPYGPFPHGGYP